jgi:hypothetical protein
MLQSLFIIILAIGVLRLFQSRQRPVKEPPVSDFHPQGGAPDPAGHTDEEGHPAFSSGEIVDGEFEEISGPQGP